MQKKNPEIRKLEICEPRISSEFKIDSQHIAHNFVYPTPAHYYVPSKEDSCQKNKENYPQAI